MWKDAARATRLVRIYNDGYNNLVSRRFDGSRLTLDAVSALFSPRVHQKRGIWRIICDGSTYLSHAVGAGKTSLAIIALMEQKRLGLITKPVVVVPGHCLAQWSREFMQLYPTAHILVADEQNFAKEKRDQFLARAATANWDAIIITHSAFKFIPTPADFERKMVNDAIASFEEMLDSVDKDDRVSTKRLERLKEGMEDKLAALKSRKDDMLTIAEIGVDQIVVDEAQAFRKLTFATNMTTLNGVDPDGSQMAWDLFVKAKYVGTVNPTRNLIMASGTPITNTMGEMFTLLRFMADDLLRERRVHEFDAWAAAFCDTRTELELQASGHYKPVTRFSEFVNVPELIAMFRSKADVVLPADLATLVDLPRVKGGKRQLISKAPTPAFKAYQKHLADRIQKIEQRSGPPRKGDDIILTVIGDGRHAAIDMRFVGGTDNEPENKLNAMIENAFLIWQENRDNVYYNPATGEPYAHRGAAQMIFSDLGTLNAEATRGFSAYRWIKHRLVELGVPPRTDRFHAGLQEVRAEIPTLRRDQCRDRLLPDRVVRDDGDRGQCATAVDCRAPPGCPLASLADRTTRGANRSARATRTKRWACTPTPRPPAWMRPCGRPTSARRASSPRHWPVTGPSGAWRTSAIPLPTSSHMAKAIASGDPRLMQKAGLEAEVARLRRLRAAHIDDQHAVNVTVKSARADIATAERRNSPD